MLKKIAISSTITMIAMLVLANIILAAPGLVVFSNPSPSNTSIILTWTPATSSNTTVIRYLTTTFPATPADGISAYSSTNFQCTVSSLTAGTTYYFSAWGYDGSSYSAFPAYCVSTTLAVALPSGGQSTTTPTFPVPTVPPSATQSPDISGFNLEPFTSIIAYFNNVTGGLGMPVANAWESFAIGFIVFCGIGVYTKQKNFFVAYFVVLLLSGVFVTLHLVQGYLVAAEIVIGAGVWAIERYFQ